MHGLLTGALVRLEEEAVVTCAAIGPRRVQADVIAKLPGKLATFVHVILREKIQDIWRSGLTDTYVHRVV